MSDAEYNSDSESSDSESSVEEKFDVVQTPGKIMDDSDVDNENESDEDDESEEESDDDESDNENFAGGAEDDEDEDEDDISDNNSDIENEDTKNEDGLEIDEQKKGKKEKSAKKSKQILFQEDDDDYEDNDDNYLQKFDNEILKNYINEFHPECLNHNIEEIAKLSVVIRNSDGIIIDPLHKTIPYLTKYEKARILGQRAKQIENGSRPLVNVPENIIDSYIIADLELKEKKIPFILRRPIPCGASEYWNLKDLEDISF